MAWDELVAAALIGTDRRPVDVSVPEGSPAGLETALAQRGAEDRLLGAAAAWTVARRAGALAGEAVTAEPATVDDRPLAPAARLRALLEGEHPELLPEWLELAAARGVRPPPELVPELLDHAVGDPALHAATGAAAGPLGRWLAERAPRWAFVRGAGDDIEGVWANGERAERRALLERLRRTDPAAGRDLIERTFAEETWEDRSAFIAALAHGLSDADEPLLEAALDDGRKVVRDAAATLLSGLPRSRYAARMAERTAPLLRVEPRRLRGRQLVVELPGEPDDAARRDGVPPGGRRSERLRELLAATPLATWTGAEATPGAPDERAAGPPAAAPAPMLVATAPATPAELVALSVADDLGDVVHAGWADAAQIQRDAAWARALWPVLPDPGLLLALPHDEAQSLASRAPEPDVAARALGGPWGPELSRAVIEAVHKRRAGGERGQDVEFAAHRLDPAFADEAEARLREVGGRDVRRLCDILSARAAMLRELT